MFPKKIHQIWISFTGRQISEKDQKYIKTIKKFHTDWEYKLWGEKDVNLFLDSIPQKYKNTYNKFKLIHQKVDFIRYLILYYQGGAYIDLDVEAIKSLNNIIEENKDYDIILSGVNLNMVESYFMCDAKTCINNGIIIAKPLNPDLLNHINYVVEQYKSLKVPCSGLINSNNFYCIQNTTGPKIFTKFLNPEKAISKIKILDYTTLEPCKRNVCDIKDNTILIHRHEATWVHPTMRKCGDIYVKYKYYIYIIILLIVLLCLNKKLKISTNLTSKLLK